MIACQGGPACVKRGRRTSALVTYTGDPPQDCCEGTEGIQEGTARDSVAVRVQVPIVAPVRDRQGRGVSSSGVEDMRV